MPPFLQKFSGTAAFVVAIALLSAGCGAQSVAGKTYVTSDGDTITFFPDGKATELNGNPTMIYAGQSLSFDAQGRPAGTSCTYSMTDNKVALDCGQGAVAGYIMSSDGSLDGPSAGLFGHASFSHLTRQR
jgi:hypothetical protein